MSGLSSFVSSGVGVFRLQHGFLAGLLLQEVCFCATLTILLTSTLTDAAEPHHCTETPDAAHIAPVATGCHALAVLSLCCSKFSTHKKHGSRAHQPELRITLTDNRTMERRYNTSYSMLAS